MTVSWSKYVFVFVLICLLAVSMGAVALYFKPHKDLTNSKPDYVFTAESFSNAIVNKDSTELKQYLEKVIELESIPTQIIQNEQSSILVFETENFEISAAMDAGIKVENASMNSIVIRCFCTGIEPSDGLFPGIVQLNRCILK